MLYAWQWLKLHKWNSQFIDFIVIWLTIQSLFLCLQRTKQFINYTERWSHFTKKNMPCLSQTNIDIRQLLHLFFCWRFFFDIKFSIFLYAPECSHAQMVRGDHIKNMAKNVEFYVEQRTRPNRMLISRLNVKLFHIYIVKGELLGVAKTK